MECLENLVTLAQLNLKTSLKGTKEMSQNRLKFV